MHDLDRRREIGRLRRFDLRAADVELRAEPQRGQARVDAVDAHVGVVDLLELALVVRERVEEVEAGLEVLAPARAGVHVVEEGQSFVLVERFEVRAEALHEPERPIAQARSRCAPGRPSGACAPNR